MYKQPADFPFWTILATAATIGILLFTLWHFNIEPVHGLLDDVFTPLTAVGSDIASKLNLTGIIDTIQTQIAENPIQTGIMAVSGAAAVIGLVGKVRADYIKDQTQQAAQQQLNNMDNTLKASEASLQQKTAEVSALQKQLSEVNTETYIQQLADKTTEITKLRGQIDALHDKIGMLEDEIAAGAKVIEKVVVK